MKKSYLAKKIEIKRLDDEKGIVEAYVSIFDNVDNAGDVIVKGAFEKTLQEKLPKVVWAHRWHEIIGKVTDAVEDKKGLLVTMKFTLDVQRAREAYALIKDGSVDEFSIGYYVIEKEVRDEDGANILKELKLFEVSLVLAGCNEQTEIVNVKDKKGALTEEVNKLEKQQQKWNNYQKILNITRGFWEIYGDDETPVDDFDVLIDDMIVLMKGLKQKEKEGDEEKSFVDALKKASEKPSVFVSLLAQTQSVEKKTVEKEGEEKGEKEGEEKNSNPETVKIIEQKTKEAVKALNFALCLSKKQRKK